MSLYRLHNFLKDNSHDVLDYWFKQSKMYFVRVISRINGSIYFIKVISQNIKMPEMNGESFEISKKYYIIDDYEEESPEQLSILYDVFICALPEYKYRYLLMNGYYIMQEKNICFQIQNMSNREHFGFFLYMEIEWFYENVYIVSDEINKTMYDIQEKINKLYNQFIPKYKTFCVQEYNIENIWDYYKNNVINIEKSKELYINLIKTENTTIHDIEYNNKISDSDDLTFQETVRRNYQNKILNEKLEQCIHLKEKVIEKNLYYHCTIWKILLKFLVMNSKFTKLQSELLQCITDFIDIMPKQSKNIFINEK